MNHHVGVSFTLSFLLVGFFAVALYTPENPSPCNARSGLVVPSAESVPPPEASDHRPSPTPGVPLVEASAATTPGRNVIANESSSAEPEPMLRPDLDPSGEFRPASHSRSTRTHDPMTMLPEPPPRCSSDARSNPLASPGPEPPPAQPQTVARHENAILARARSAFTFVGEGETLVDVAVRVYGSSEASQTIWLSNRDVIEFQDMPLREGMLLRTP